ncbi:MAG: heavy metal translocating P-type ATPase, partial [Anaerolineae bacterium]|nr:heavy metal translocating P-type ATPase [Anaerolineae bacterium]
MSDKHQGNHERHDGEHNGGGGMAGHSGHEAMFRRRFWINALLTIPILLFSPVLQEILGFSMPSFPGSRWVAPGVALAVFFYGGIPFIRMAIPEVQRGKPGMMTLISLAIGVSFVYSVFAVFRPASGSFFWEMATLIDVMLLGHWIEMRSIRQASGALEELAKLMPDTAERVVGDNETEEVSLDELSVDDVVLVRPGASVPADGEVVEGVSSVNQSMITGESRPVKKGPGDEVVGGTIN